MREAKQQKSAPKSTNILETMREAKQQKSAPVTPENFQGTFPKHELGVDEDEVY